MVINYITYDSWWDTDITIIPELVKKYHLNVFVLSPFDNCKYPQKKSDKMLNWYMYVKSIEIET